MADSVPDAPTVNEPRLVGVENKVAEALLPGCRPSRVNAIDVPADNVPAAPDELFVSSENWTDPIEPTIVSLPDHEMFELTG